MCAVVWSSTWIDSHSIQMCIVRCCNWLIMLWLCVSVYLLFPFASYFIDRTSHTIAAHQQCDRIVRYAVDSVKSTTANSAIDRYHCVCARRAYLLTLHTFAPCYKTHTIWYWARANTLLRLTINIIHTHNTPYIEATETYRTTFTSVLILPYRPTKNENHSIIVQQNSPVFSYICRTIACACV